MDKFLEYVYPMDFLIGTIFIVVSLVTKIFPPKEINAVYGYRTSTSMKSQEAWSFAQEYSSNKMIHSGVFLVVISFLKILIGINCEVFFNLFFVLLSVIYLFFTTERAIKNRFK